MANFNPNIFRSNDIRGIYGEDFDAEFGRTLGTRFAAFVGSEHAFVVGRDERVGSKELADAVIDGARHAGAHVTDVGTVSSPQFYWAIRAMNGAGGIMVTASHNPPQYNGFKPMIRRGATLEIVGGHHLRQIYDSHGHGHGHGVLARRDILAEYGAAVAYAAGWEGGTELRLSVDGPRSVERVLTRLGPVAPDEHFGVRFDTDGDRVMFFTDGKQIPADFIFLLLTEHLNLHPVVHDLRFSRIVTERLKAGDIARSVTKVGRLYITLAMQKEQAMFGGEISGHYYWREFGGLEAPELTVLRLYRLCDGDPEKLRTLIAPYQLYANSGEVSVPVKDHKHAVQIVGVLEKKFAHHHLDRTDGLTVDAWDSEGWWCNVRPSNTEPLIRMVVETKNPDTLEPKLAEVRSVLD